MASIQAQEQGIELVFFEYNKQLSQGAEGRYNFKVLSSAHYVCGIRVDFKQTSEMLLSALAGTGWLVLERRQLIGLSYCRSIYGNIHFEIRNDERLQAP
jgi:hypothetical protein